MDKILATLGPSSLDPNTIRQMDEFGVNMFRINLSHTAIEDVADCIHMIRSNSDTPICLDSEGAQIRNQNMANGTAFFEAGSHVAIHFTEVLGDAHNISFTPVGIARHFEPDDVVNIDFNNASLRVIEKHDDKLIAEVVGSGLVGSRKAADINRDVPLAPITGKDREAIKIGRSLGIRNYALSFAGSVESVNEMRSLCGEDASIISKIESPSGLRNLKGIILASNAILIDRGDLSRTIPIEKVPFLQRRIISMGRTYDTPVYVATNFLESMIQTAMPNRSEVNDIVSTLLTGADGVVLAAETAVGKYPVECIATARTLLDYKVKWTSESSIENILDWQKDTLRDRYDCIVPNSDQKTVAS